jgi:hypothetical protein
MLVLVYHMQIHIYFGEEEEDDDNNPEAVPVGDLETVVSTNEAHRQHGRVVNE